MGKKRVARVSAQRNPRDAGRGSKQGRSRVGPDRQATPARHTDPGRLPAEDLRGLIADGRDVLPVNFIVDLAQILWPEEDPHQDWDSDTLDAIDGLFERYAWHPLTRSS